MEGFTLHLYNLSDPKLTCEGAWKKYPLLKDWFGQNNHSVLCSAIGIQCQPLTTGIICSQCPLLPATPTGHGKHEFLQNTLSLPLWRFPAIEHRDDLFVYLFKTLYFIKIQFQNNLDFKGEGMNWITGCETDNGTDTLQIGFGLRTEVNCDSFKSNAGKMPRSWRRAF